MMSGLLSARFQGRVLQVALGGCFQSLATEECRTSESDLLDLHVKSYDIADNVTVADEDVDDTGGKPTPLMRWAQSGE